MNAQWYSEVSRLVLQLLEGQKRIEARLGTANERSWFSPDDFGKAIGRRPSTIRRWCREGRLMARKRPVGRGDKLEWEIPVMEAERYKNHGLRPLRGTHVDDRTLDSKAISTAT